ncbi:MAG TPA: c-type cytochrome biogenesis protein CcmI, partial [Thermopetrobacter sp.]|nr:c-type cytochrome biogenesis protein CcmI [Thermopetrobacter sp.]
AIYKDQLRELEEDEKNGLITAAEAKAARNEIARRILAADAARRHAEEALARASGRDKLVGFAVALIAVPAIAVAVYMAVGRPGMPDLPIAERMRDAARHNDIMAMLRRVEERLATHPDDLEGWRVVAPVYVRIGRLDKAVAAYRNAIRLSPKPDPDLYNGLGEALVMAARGRLTKEAREAFRRALKLAPGNPMSRFYLAQAAVQDGRTAEALRQLRALLADLPENFAGRAIIRSQIARLEGGGATAAPPGQGGANAAGGTASPSSRATERSPKTAPGEDSHPPAASGEPSAEAVRARMKAMREMSPQQRQRMIRDMVEGLEARLKENPEDLAGWLRLIRAWSVLGEKEKARSAYDAAKKALGGRAGAVEELDRLAKSLAL